jgi:hypothetical protein
MKGGRLARFVQLYQRLFARLGCPLSRRDGFSDRAIEEFERRTGTAAPLALADFYLIAGRAAHFIGELPRWLPPRDWVIRDGKLIFSDEPHAGSVWAANVGRKSGDDPPLFMGVWAGGLEDRLEWQRLCPRCSTFISVMVCWAAAGGTMAHTAQGVVRTDPLRSNARGWKLVGTAKAVRAYSKRGKVLCLSKRKKERSWRISVGTQSREELGAIAKELKVSLEPVPVSHRPIKG